MGKKKAGPTRREAKGTQGVMLELRPGIHPQIKGLAGSLGMSLTDAYGEAVTLWVAYISNGRRQPSAFGEITDHERAVLHGVLCWLRDASTKDTDKEPILRALQVLAERYTERPESSKSLRLVESGSPESGEPR